MKEKLKAVSNVSQVKKAIYDYIYSVNTYIESNYPNNGTVEGDVLFNIIFSLVELHAYKVQLLYAINNKKYLKKLITKDTITSTTIYLHAELRMTEKQIKTLEDVIPERVLEFDVLDEIRKYINMLTMLS